MEKQYHRINYSRISEVIGDLQHTFKFYSKTITFGIIWQEIQESTIIDKNTIQFISFTGEKEKLHMWSVNLWQDLESQDNMSC